LNFRLKRLQVIDFITHKGVLKNLSIPTNDFLHMINTFEKLNRHEVTQGFYWFYDQSRGLFSEILMPWGLCSVFNIASREEVLHVDNTSSDFHYEIISNKGPVNLTFKIPRKTKTSEEGFTIHFQLDDDNEFVGVRQGSIAVIHNSHEFPTMNAVKIPFNGYKKTYVWIQPQMNSIDESLEDFSPADRNCYLEHEKKLKFFKVYTQKNCENECLSDFLIEKCNCVEFFMIRNESTRICGINEILCYEKSKTDFEMQKESCGCLLPCNYVKFEVEIEEKNLNKYEIL
jgi:amiloride-sensitive sodium channel